MNQLPWLVPLSEPTRAIGDRRWMVAATLSASSNMFADAHVVHSPTLTITTASWWSDLIDRVCDALMKFVPIKRAAEWIRDTVDAVDWGGLVDWIGNLLHLIQLRTRQ